MNFVDWRGKAYTMSLTPYTADNDEEKHSDLHNKAKKIIKEVYPTDPLCEELYLPGPLYIDLFLPIRRIAVEVHGQQHYDFNSFFFKDKLKFGRAQQRDKKKAEWCELNNITLIEFAYNESEEEWKIKLQQG